MQTPKTGNGSAEVPQKRSPATPRTARQLKIAGADSDKFSSSPRPSIKTPKERSPKVVERRSPRSPVIEKKRPIRVTELEAQLSKLQEDLKKTKDQLNASESSKRRAHQEAEEAKKKLSAISAKLEESQQQLMEITSSEDARIEELRKISKDRDKVWESELEAVRKQNSFDSAALASAVNEIQKLKTQLEKVVESEAVQSKHAESAHEELRSLRMELTETLSLVETMKSELSDCKESEAQAIEEVEKTNSALELVQSELEQSKARVRSLEDHVGKLENDLMNGDKDKMVESTDEINRLKEELNQANYEIGQLRSDLDASETRYQEEYVRSTLQIRSAYEEVEKVKLESSRREADMERELKDAKSTIEELRANLMDKETELWNISEENKGLNLKMETNKNENNPSEKRDSELAMLVKKLEEELAEVKTSIMDKDTELNYLTEQNKLLKVEIDKRETERGKENNETMTLVEAAREAEKEAIMKVGSLTEEADKSNKRVAHVTEQLDAAQAANTEMEAELRRLKVQSDQWRKAAEAATAMLSSGNNGKLVERGGSDFNGIMGSPYLEDIDDDDSPKKKNGNVLKKFGLWKKVQK